jgi:hypothetical protein
VGLKDRITAGQPCAAELGAVAKLAAGDPAIEGLDPGEAWRKDLAPCARAPGRAVHRLPADSVAACLPRAEARSASGTSPARPPSSRWPGGLILAVMVLNWLWRLLRRGPRPGAASRRAQRQEGYRALSQGMAAVAADDARPPGEDRQQPAEGSAVDPPARGADGPARRRRDRRAVLFIPMLERPEKAFVSPRPSRRATGPRHCRWRAAPMRSGRAPLGRRRCSTSNLQLAPRRRASARRLQVGCQPGFADLVLRVFAVFAVFCYPMGRMD